MRSEGWKRGGERWAGKGGSNVKRNQMESTGKSEDMLAGRMETSRLDGGMGEKLEGAQLRFWGRLGFVSQLEVLRWKWEWGGWGGLGSVSDSPGVTSGCHWDTCQSDLLHHQWSQMRTGHTTPYVSPLDPSTAYKQALESLKGKDYFLLDTHQALHWGTEKLGFQINEWLLNYEIIFFFLNVNTALLNTEGIWTYNWRGQKCCANLFKKSVKNLLNRFSAKHVQQVLLVLVSNDLHMSFVWIWPYQMHGDETHFTTLPFI